MDTGQKRSKANIYKRGRRYWITYTDATGKRRWESARQKEKGIDGTREADAIRLLNERQGEAAKGQPTHRGKLPFADALQAVLQDQERNQRRAAAHTKRRIDLHLEPHFRGWRIGQITTEAIREYVNTRQQTGAKPATINRELAIVRRALRLAQRAGHVHAVPHVEMLDESRNIRTGFVEAEDFTRLQKHLRPEVYADAALFAFVTGWRVPSEVLPLTWSQVDMRRGLIRLEPGTSKAGEGRSFPITAMLRPMLTRREQEKHTDANLVFHEDGQPIHRRRFHKAWTAAREAAKLPALIPHDLRRSAVLQLERARVPRKVAMQMVGHQTESIYRRYHIVPEADVFSAGASLDALTAGPGQRDKNVTGRKRRPTAKRATRRKH